MTTLDITVTRNDFGTGEISGTTAGDIGGSRDGIFIENRAGTMNLLIGGSVGNANTVQSDNSTSDAIMEIEADDAAGTVNATVTNNSFSSSGNAPVEFDMQADSSSMCVDLKDNTASNTGTEWVSDGNGHGTGIKIEGTGTGNVTEGQMQGAPHNNTGSFSFTAPVTNNNNTNCTLPSP